MTKGSTHFEDYRRAAGNLRASYVLLSPLFATFLRHAAGSTTEQTVRAKPDTLLCTMLDDPAQQRSAKKPIFVQGNSCCFQYIMDWYRYGSMRVPSNVSIEMLRRECAYFQLPDDVSIKRGHPALEEAVQTLQDAKAEVRARIVACSVFEYFLERMPANYEVTIDGEFHKMYPQFAGKVELPR
eukprot:2888200-Amphidinium_carterae.1